MVSKIDKYKKKLLKELVKSVSVSVKEYAKIDMYLNWAIAIGYEVGFDKGLKTSPKSKRRLATFNILQISPDTNKVVGKYHDFIEALESTGICEESIKKVISGSMRTAGGYKWKYDNRG